MSAPLARTNSYNPLRRNGWESGIVTACVSVADMLRWGREQLKKDPTCFLAGIR